ncbi:secreted protein [Candidatus Thiomargarita nelsonii]|uniref:Secreted protein n=1 Tax=Candidatus Thiomargarita nelsonii TaxID=1003181 RepID=A0A0A6P002_9GAMM|nr:secreted protein [Candidatus Thiomargarita nelsonii]
MRLIFLGLLVSIVFLFLNTAYAGGGCTKEVIQKMLAREWSKTEIMEICGTSQAKKPPAKSHPISGTWLVEVKNLSDHCTCDPYGIDYGLSGYNPYGIDYGLSGYDPYGTDCVLSEHENSWSCEKKVEEWTIRFSNTKLTVVRDQEKLNPQDVKYNENEVHFSCFTTTDFNGSYFETKTQYSLKLMENPNRGEGTITENDVFHDSNPVFKIPGHSGFMETTTNYSLRMIRKLIKSLPPKEQPELERFFPR